MLPSLDLFHSLRPLWTETTPQGLIDEGLYKHIAIGLQEMPHREVSIALVAQVGRCPHPLSHTQREARATALRRDALS